MGRRYARIEITGILSNHNSEDDKIDEALFQEVADQVREIIKDPKYDRISLDISVLD